MNEILQYLKNRGECLDSEIAQAIGISLADAKKKILELPASGDVMSYQSTRFEKGKKIEGMRCRLAGFTPPAAPGRKAKVQLKIS